jgi:fucose permease
VDASTTFAAAVRGRWAIAAIFTMNGFLIGSWAPQIPVFLTRLGISEFTLGLLILLFGAGAVSAMAWAGHLIARHGSEWTIRLFAWTGVFGLLLVALAPNVPVAAVTLYLFGGMIGGMDVAMNANAVTVEKKLSRAIMSSSHGFWSLGGFAGGALGGIVIQQYGHLAHAAMVTLVTLCVAMLALRHPAVYLLGLMALLAMNSEGAVLDWAALYLRQELGADIAMAGFAFAGFAGAMALLRFFGDGVRNRFGAVTTLRISTLVAAAGMLLAGLAPSPWVAIAAFSLCGLGIANVVPILFSAAGNQPGTTPGAGMSVVTLMGYSGILVAPSAIGLVGGRVGFSPVFIAVAFLLVVVCLMSRLAEAAEFDHRPGE